MSGINYVLDTNAIISLLKGNQTIENELKQASWVGISIISLIEFLSYKNLTTADKHLFDIFLQRVEVVDLSQNDPLLIDEAISRRTTNNLKLPDAIIASTAITRNAHLVSNDNHFTKTGITLLNF